MVRDLRTERKGKILAVKDLPTLPKVLDEVSRLVEDPESSTEQIARVIAYDQVLSAKILKMVNSPIYGFPGRNRLRAALPGAAGLQRHPGGDYHNLRVRHHDQIHGGTLGAQFGLRPGLR